MKNMFQVIVAVAMAIGTAAAVPTLAWARTRPGFGGVPTIPSDQPFFVYDGTVIGGQAGLGLHNTSASTKSFLFDLPSDVSQAYTVIVRVAENGLSSGFATCQAFTVGLNGAGIAGGGAMTSANFTGYQNLVLTSAVVPPGGTLYVTCQVSGSNTVKILSLDWF